MIKAIIAVLIVAAALAVGAYYVTIPSTWPSPDMTVDVPKTAELGRDISITVNIHSQHPNVSHHMVRFFPAGYFSSASIPEKLLLPVDLEDGEPKEYWNKDEVELETRETNQSFKYVVPLSEQYVQGRLGPGTLKGRVDVVVDYPSIPESGGLFTDRFPNVSETLSASFQIELVE